MLSSALARIRSFWRGTRGRSAVELDMEEEFRLHIELRTEDLVRSGIPAGEAARQARLEFGMVEKHKEGGRASRGLTKLDDVRFSWLDLKLSSRMLIRYPGLTLVAGIGIGFAIWVGATTFEFISQVVYPSLPLEDGKRIVGIRLLHTAEGDTEEQALFDFVTWREEVESVEHLGAFRTVSRNVLMGDGRAEPARLAEISASAFDLVQIPPLLGRPLIDADEAPGAPAVLVMGYDLWKGGFGGDPQIIGRTVQLGAEPTTVVGVMPEDFAFPIFHNLWIPLRLDRILFAPRAGPSINVFGRLAPGASFEQAQAELTAISLSIAAANPETHAQLRPHVEPYAELILYVPPRYRMALSAAFLSANLVPLLLLSVICANVALLMFARAATRESELTVRAALGASRGRIIGQLFAEALVLGGVGAAFGLAATHYGLRWVLNVVSLEFFDAELILPFWFRVGLSPATIVYAGFLTVFGAALAGFLPALKVTRGVGARLKQATAGGGGIQFGGIWTVVIVVQVALTVAFPPIAFAMRQEARTIETRDVGFDPATYLSAQLEMDVEALSGMDGLPREELLARFSASYTELERRLEAEPQIIAVTLSDRLPRMYHPWNQVEIDEGATVPPDERGHRMGVAAVDVDFFEAFGSGVVAGRSFTPADVLSRANVVVVNEPFVQNVLGGKNPVGRHIRIVANEASRIPSYERPWQEIIGVVPDLGAASGYGRTGVYTPLYSASHHPLHIALHLRGDPVAVAPRLRAIAAQVDPLLQLHEVIPMTDTVESDVAFYQFWARLGAGVSALTLMLSLAGIYAVVSFAVSRRTREIGVRVALGSNRRSVLLAVLARPLFQVGLGIFIGGFITMGIWGESLLRFGRNDAIVGGYVLFMLGVCMLACIVPVRRALRIEPTEAMRTEG